MSLDRIVYELVYASPVFFFIIIAFVLTLDTCKTLNELDDEE